MKLVCLTHPKHLFQVTFTTGVELSLPKVGWHLLRTIFRSQHVDYKH